MGYGDEMDSRVVRGAVASFISGILFAGGWWVLIDGYTMGNKQQDVPTAATASYAWLPPFFASLMYFSLNAMVSSKVATSTHYLFLHTLHFVSLSIFSSSHTNINFHRPLPRTPFSFFNLSAME